ncbi:MAG: OmpH family outer membrane protein [Ignavibacteriaceae bacterium]|nr:OmpH family outer membrane protein [Ignavibacteriaceae bacterium]
MKKIVLSVLLYIFIFSGFSYSQLKIGFVDSKTILSKLPDAQDARQKLDAVIRDWQGELKKMEDQKKTKQDDYDKRKLLMSEQTRADLEDQIKKLDQQISDYRDKKFGANGELFKQQEDLMKPVQNKIFTAIQEVAKDEELDFVFDRSNAVVLLFAKDKYDVTSLVMEKLKLQQ